MSEDKGHKACPEITIDTVAVNLARFLNVLLAIDYDVDVIDRLAKARKLDEFMEAVYNALRRRENLEQSLERELKKLASGSEPEKSESEDKGRREPGGKEELERALRYLRMLCPSQIDVLHRYLSERPGELRRWASYIGARALAYNRVFGALRSIFR